MRDRLMVLAGVMLFASLVLVEAARPQQPGAAKDSEGRSRSRRTCGWLGEPRKAADEGADARPRSKT